MAKSASWFVAGATIGAAASLLCAPHSGRRTRRIMRRKLDHGREYVSVVGKDVADAGQEIYGRGKEAVGSATKYVNKGLKKVRKAA